MRCSNISECINNIYIEYTQYIDRIKTSYQLDIYMRPNGNPVRAKSAQLSDNIIALQRRVLDFY